MQPKAILDVKAQLGEGAIWHTLEKRLYWVDIESKLLHVFNPATGLNSTYNTFERIGTVIPARGGGAVLALQNGIALIDLLDGKIRDRFDPEKDIPGNRFNDGKCDPQGRLWVGGAVGCWDPKTGDLLDLVRLPVPNVTSCAFGGEHLNQLFITTAREGLTNNELEQYADSGCLFKVEMGIHGVPAFLFG